MEARIKELDAALQDAREKWLIFGSSNSPYSLKVLEYFRFKRIKHEWVAKTNATSGEFQRHAKLPLVPLVVSPEGKAKQDSTPIIEMLEERYLHPYPRAVPKDQPLRFVCQMIEEYADEWVNKYMFHYRWRRDVDQLMVSRRLAAEMLDTTAQTPPNATMENVADMIRQRMSTRGFAVGSNDDTAPIIERYFSRLLRLLEAHLNDREFLFGSRPSIADFALGAQIYQMLIDPTPSAIVEASPSVASWCQRLLDVEEDAESEYEPWASLQKTLQPILDTEVKTFLTWSFANANAMMRGKKELVVELEKGVVWKQKLGGPQKYHVKSLKALRTKFKLLGPSPSKDLEGILAHSGTLPFFLGDHITTSNASSSRL